MYQMRVQGSVLKTYKNVAVDTYKSCLHPTSFVFNGYLGHLNIQVLEHEGEYKSVTALYGAEMWTLRKVDQKYLESF
jgi:hypothetical protein